MVPFADEEAVMVVPTRCKRNQRRAGEGVPPEIDVVVLLSVVRRTKDSALVGETNKLACRAPAAVVSRKVKPARDVDPTATCEATFAMMVTSPVMA